MRTLGGVLARTAGQCRLEGDANAEITDVTNDSRSVRSGAMYCCVRGERHDGHDFAADAVRRGAGSLLVDHVLPSCGVPQVVVGDTRRAMGQVAAAFHDHPCESLKVIGVTGTNGKTTTAHMLGAILNHSGERTTVLGTLSGIRTTPESPELQRTLAQERDGGTTAVVMEVSSHALALQRVAGMRFRSTVFTNLGHDHLDFHRTQDAYFAAKQSLFSKEYTAIGIINGDDPFGRVIAEHCDIEVALFGMADAGNTTVDAAGSEFSWRGARIHCVIGGDFNVLNALAAATTAAELGISPNVIAAGLGAMSQIPGRFERVVHGGNFSVFVDYAHTPEALGKVIATARALVDGSPTGGTRRPRVIVVFGCGGDRDPSKRQEMGRVACTADLVVVTSDNPRHESPEAIIEAIIAGVPDSERGRVVSEVDRRRAISVACESAGPGDVVIIAGRGHEATQSIAGEEIPFLDAHVVRSALGVSE